MFFVLDTLTMRKILMRTSNIDLAKLWISRQDDPHNYTIAPAADYPSCKECDQLNLICAH